MHTLAWITCFLLLFAINFSIPDDIYHLQIGQYRFFSMKTMEIFMCLRQKSIVEKVSITQ